MLYQTMENTFPMKTHERIRILNFFEETCCEYTRITATYTLVDAKRLTSHYRYSGPLFSEQYSAVRNINRNHLIAKKRSR